MPNNAQYTGGYSPGAQLFAVDGDFTSCDPADAPEFSFPFRGDSILSINDIVVFDSDTLDYELFPLGTYPNIQPWLPNQDAIILEQDFITAQEAYETPRLNTPYNPAWAIGWAAQFPDGVPIASLNQFYFVEEGELRDIGGGLVRIRRKFSTLPHGRNEIEQYAYTFIGMDSSNSPLTPNNPVSRPSFTRNVMSRIRYDYFIFDDYEILAGQLPTFPNGPRLNSTTGIQPDGLILAAMQYFASQDIFTNFGIFVGTPADSLSDGDPTDPSTASLPSATDYLGWSAAVNTSNGLPAEIVAESSTFTRWLGNIWERRTRFVLAQ